MSDETVKQTENKSFWQGCNDYYQLCKPKVVALIVFTAIVGMLLATPVELYWQYFPWQEFFFGTIGIGLASASAAAINHVVDRRIDAIMKRTQGRPLPTGQLNSFKALLFALVLGAIAMVILVLAVNTITAILTFISLIGYAVIYTMYLKRATPQNIVIGGAAGAAPPLLGWTAITGQVDPQAWLLFLIIFIWTPPHFWALAVYRKDEYAKVDVPMLPVTHGEAFTRLHILLYTVLLVIVTLLPYLTGMSGLIYLLGVTVLNAFFMMYAVKLYITHEPSLAIKTFVFSINYLMFVFALLLIDHYKPIIL